MIPLITALDALLFHGGDDDDGVSQLMKLNEDWDQVYRSATLSLQHRVESLELENNTIKQLNSRLLLKVEHQQVSTQKVLQATSLLHWCVHRQAHADKRITENTGGGLSADFWRCRVQRSITSKH